MEKLLLNPVTAGIIAVATIVFGLFAFGYLSNLIRVRRDRPYKLRRDAIELAAGKFLATAPLLFFAYSCSKDATHLDVTVLAESEDDVRSLGPKLKTHLQESAMRPSVTIRTVPDLLKNPRPELSQHIFLYEYFLQHWKHSKSSEELG